jgi:thioredoxin 1
LSDTIVTLTGENWNKEVLESAEPVLVDFWASWCAPCRALAPAIDELSKSLSGRLKVGKLNVDEHPELGERYGVRSIPTLLVFRGGAVAEQRVGLVGKPELEKWVSGYLTPAAAQA